MSSAFSLKKPLRMPMSSGVKLNASGTALPTRSVCNGCARPCAAESAKESAKASVAAARNEIVRFTAISPRSQGLVIRQERFGIELAHIGFAGKYLHFDERAAQYGERLRIEM